MKLLLCALNSKYIHSTLAPWALGAGVDAYCQFPVEWQVFEGNINQSDQQVLSGIGNLSEVDLLGFSCYIWNIPMVLRLANTIRQQYPHLPILLGGPEVSFNAKEILREHPAITFILCGEGERCLPLLLDCMAAGQPVDQVPGLAYRTEQGVQVNPAQPLTEDPPSPYTERYLATLKGRIAYIETSRGCPFSCAFCLSGREDMVRFFSLQRAKQDIITLANSGAKTIKFVDRTFNCNPARAYELVHFIIEQTGKVLPSSGVCYHLEVAADLFEEPLLALLESAPPGLFQLEAGLQSFQPDTLVAVSRKTNLQRLTQNLRRLIQAGTVHVHVDLIAGLPYEGLAEFADSFDQAYALSPHMLQLGFLKLLHGSRLRAEAEEMACRYSPDPPYEIIENRWLSEQDIAVLHATEDALERLYNSGRFLTTLEYVLSATGWRPFELFRRFGQHVQQQGGAAGMPLDQYTALFQRYFAAVPGVDPAVLRDMMVRDRLASQAGGMLPPCLRIPDKRLRPLQRQAAKYSKGKPVRQRAVAILYTPEDTLLTADYTQRNPVTGRYTCWEQPLAEG